MSSFFGCALSSAAEGLKSVCRPIPGVFKSRGQPDSTGRGQSGITVCLLFTPGGVMEMKCPLSASPHPSTIIRHTYTLIQSKEISMHFLPWCLISVSVCASGFFFKDHSAFFFCSVTLHIPFLFSPVASRYRLPLLYCTPARHSIPLRRSRVWMLKYKQYALHLFV